MRSRRSLSRRMVQVWHDSRSNLAVGPSKHQMVCGRAVLRALQKSTDNYILRYAPDLAPLEATMKRNRFGIFLNRLVDSESLPT